MKYWNKNLQAMSEYIPGEQPTDIDKFIKLNTNENPFPPSGPVLEAMRKSCNQNLRLYPNPDADNVRKIFADLNNLPTENIFISNGSDELFTLIFRCFVDKDSLAAFAYPSYALYYTMAEANGIPYEKINLDKNLNLNLNKFLKKKYDLVIITNPNNPTGNGPSAQEIETFLKKFKGLLVIDEAYVDFYGDSVIELVKEYDNLIVTRSLSKSYSLAGLRVGIAAAHQDLIKGFLRLKDSYNVDRIAQAGAVAALKEQQALKENILMIRNNKEYLEEMLTELDFTIIPSKANFIFVKHSTIPAKKIYEELKNRKILIRFFEGKIQDQYIRITIGTMLEIKSLLAAIKDIIAQ